MNVDTLELLRLEEKFPLTEGNAGNLRLNGSYQWIIPICIRLSICIKFLKVAHSQQLEGMGYVP